ncbi:hypothetical protein E0H26_11610 [Micromonospora zingiberis]|uniref:PD-(D/E)XK endonuclease-like domain-containing protein n=1 Tax=Micromonospora zingiberis TaxID=2053011 RepID=A0A4R0GPX6_9ACTN|nr:hypothetical protein [Micromonospora zingiberis]TCB97558.1 hypothetical protein E0H26_11610 [Micromonospora zingiberis]
MTTVEEFMKAAPARLGGNSPWASRYASELRRVVVEQANGSARNRQRHLGPSELGVPCDRQVVGKLAGLPATNHVVDPWASIVGTAVHAWLADAFTAANAGLDFPRWLAEQRVTPHPEHPGTADLYDAVETAVVDHKILGESSMAKVRSNSGPPIHYQIQLLLYGKGYRILGLPVTRVALAAYPRTSASLDGLYVWERATGPQDDALIEEVFKLTDRRKAMAEEILNGSKTLTDIPITADDDTCFFCPYYRPQSKRDNGPGCPGPNN